MPGPLIQAQPLPWWMDPQGASVMDPLAITLARKAASLTGLDDPQSAVMQGAAGVPLIAAIDSPGSLIKALLKYRHEPLGDAIGKFMSTVNQTELAKPAPSAILATSSTGSALSGPTTFKRITLDMLDRVPEAAGKFDFSQARLKRPFGFINQARQEGAIRAAFKPSFEENLKRQIARGVFERPSITSPDQLSDIVSAPPPPSPAPPLLSASTRLGNRLATLAKSGLTEDVIRDIRTLPIDEAIAKYPNMPRDAIKNIIDRNSWTWVKD